MPDLPHSASILAVLLVVAGTACTGDGYTTNSDAEQSQETAAYFILTQTVTDQMAYSQQYIPGVLPFLAKHGAEVLVASFETEALQGEPADGAVVLRFPSEQAVRNFVNDPDYRPLKELRLSITRNANAVLAPEFEWPESEE